MSGNALVRYLGTSQEKKTKQPFSYACVTISLFSGLFLAYSKEASLAGIRRIFDFAADQWEASVKLKHSLLECEVVDNAYGRYTYVNSLLTPSDIYTGLSVKDNEENRDFGGSIVYGSVLSALREVGKRASVLPLHHSIAFTFTRGLYTLGGVVRSLGGVGGTYGVVVHFVDSHNRILPFAMPPEDMHHGSAVWVTAQSIEQAARAIEAIYPPHDPASEQEDTVVGKMHDTLTEVPKDMSFAARRNAGETRLIHPGQFELRTFLPRYNTPAEALSTADRLCGS